MPTGGLRPRIKCGAVKLTSDRAFANRLALLLLCRIGNLAASRSRVGLSCSCGLGVRASPHGALGAPSPRRTCWRPRYAQKIWSGPVLPPPEISRGGHGIRPSSALAARGVVDFIHIHWQLAEPMPYAVKR
jgi:hypothetical protein